MFHRLPDRQERLVSFTFDGLPITGRKGDSVAAALLAAGWRGHGWRKWMSRTVHSAADLAPAYDLVVVGAGPAGLSAATEAAAHGLAVLLTDENETPGGQIYRAVTRAGEADLARMGPDYAAGRALVERFLAADVTYASRRRPGASRQPTRRPATARMRSRSGSRSGVWPG